MIFVRLLARQYLSLIHILNSKKFGAVFYGLTDKKQRFILDEISEETIKTMEQSFDKIKRVGLQKLLNGALPRNYRTAASVSYTHLDVYKRQDIRWLAESIDSYSLAR